MSHRTAVACSLAVWGVVVLIGFFWAFAAVMLSDKDDDDFPNGVC